jgi:hypothetical protein
MMTVLWMRRSLAVWPDISITGQTSLQIFCLPGPTFSGLQGYRTEVVCGIDFFTIPFH